MNSSMRVPKTFTVLVSVFVTTLVISNVIATKLISVWEFIVPAGVIAYPITFLMTDVIGEVWGKRIVSKVVWAGFFCSVLAMGLGLFAVYLPSAPFYTQQEFFAGLFGTVGRITVASLIAYIVSQFNDIHVFHYLKDRTKGKHLWLRNNVGTMSSQFFDTAIFITIAFYGTMPFSDLVSLALNQWMVKIFIALIDTPFCYLLVAWCKKHSNKKRYFSV